MIQFLNTRRIIVHYNNILKIYLTQSLIEIDMDGYQNMIIVMDEIRIIYYIIVFMNINSTVVDKLVHSIIRNI